MIYILENSLRGGGWEKGRGWPSTRSLSDRLLEMEDCRIRTIGIVVQITRPEIPVEMVHKI